MSNVDWSKAPEGATHWMPESQYWEARFWKREGKANYVFEGGEWKSSLAKPFGHPALVIRPDTTQWNGEGLPPVGAYIEVFHPIYGWIGARSVGSDGEAAIVRTNDGYAGAFPHQMRPIRTPEQIAAEERERAIKEMWSVYWQPHAATAMEGLGLLYDAGYRKQEQPE